MIKRLRIKIVVVIMSILTLTVFAIMTAINIVSWSSNHNEIETRLYRLADNDGFLPTDEKIEIFHDSQSGYVDTFSVQINRFYEVRKIVISRNINVEQSVIIEYANEALNSDSNSGELGSYAFLVNNRPYGKIIVFMDIQPYQQAAKNLFLITSLTGLISIIFFFIVSFFLAKWLVKPVKSTLEKQKQFISDASHELKTPLAVISTNTDVLEAEIGENKWLGYIRSESVRMSELVNELLCLARLDDKSSQALHFAETDLSQLVLQTALPFESVLFEMGKIYSVEVQPDIKAKVDESSIKHVLTILIDNAVKYSKENGEITVKLYMHSGRKIIEVYNTGDGVPKEKLGKIFERFYREDEARNRKTGGYGLGLAIAKASAEAHGGKISAKGEYGSWICFTVTLP